MVRQRHIKASEFKARCLQIMDEVAESGEPVIITKNGRPVSKLVPADERPQTLVGAMKGEIRILGDIVAPAGEVWEAENDHPRHPRRRLAPRRR